MLTALALASSLWFAAADAGARAIPSDAFVAVPVEKISDSIATDIALNVFGTSLDLYTGDWAFARGCIEGNFLLPRPESRAAGKLALAGFRGTISYVLRRKGHKTAADVFRWAGLATDLAISTNNIVCGKRSGGDK